MQIVNRKVVMPLLTLAVESFDPFGRGNFSCYSCLFLVRRGRRVIEKLGGAGFSSSGDLKVNVNVMRVAYYLDKGLRINCPTHYTKALSFALLGARYSLHSTNFRFTQRRFVSSRSYTTMGVVVAPTVPSPISTEIDFFARALAGKVQQVGLRQAALPPVGSLVETFFFAPGAKLMFFRGVLVSKAFLGSRVRITNFVHRVTLTFNVSAPSFCWITSRQFSFGKRSRKFIRR